MTKTTHQPRIASAPSHATVFIWIFAVSAIWHYTSSSSDIVNYWFHYNPLVTPLVFLSIVSAFAAALFPSKMPVLLIFAGGQIVAIFLRFPFVADHLVMELFLHCLSPYIGLGTGGALAMFSGLRTEGGRLQSLRHHEANQAVFLSGQGRVHRCRYQPIVACCIQKRSGHRFVRLPTAHYRQGKLADASDFACRWSDLQSDRS